MNTSIQGARYGSGQAVRRIEDDALLSGRGRFTDDLVRANLGHVVFVRSPYAHARIRSVDVSGALALPGVLAAWSSADLVAAGIQPISAPLPFPRPDGKPGVTPVRHVLALDV